MGVARPGRDSVGGLLLVLGVAMAVLGIGLLAAVVVGWSVLSTSGTSAAIGAPGAEGDVL